jgi:hypothetical protein
MPGERLAETDVLEDLAKYRILGGEVQLVPAHRRVLQQAGVVAPLGLVLFVERHVHERAYGPVGVAGDDLAVERLLVGADHARHDLVDVGELVAGRIDPNSGRCRPSDASLPV